MQKIRNDFLVTIILSLLIGGLSGFASSLFVLTFFPSSNYNWIVFGNKNQMANAPISNVLSDKAVQSDSDKTIDVVKKASPAVVSVIVTKDVSRYTQNYTQFDAFLKDFPFDFKIETPLPQPKSGDVIKPNKQQVGGGSGFVVSPDGLILTNKHVVSDVDAEYTVVMNGGKRYPAKLLASDQLLDVAVLKIEAQNLPVVTLGNSDKIANGQTVIAIGYVLGQYENTVTKGIISGIKRRVVAGDGTGSSEVLEAAIQTDAAINPGNSGGPLLNLRGEVIGINTAINRGGEAVGFALPINSIKTIIESVKKYGRIVRPWLGVRYVILNKDIAEKNQLKFDYGALVARGQTSADLAVVPGSPADKAGLLENDIILEVNGEKVIEENGLGSLVSKYKVGDEISMKVASKGEIKTVKVKLEEMKDVK